ncbi:MULTISPECIES: hypothetical protein [Marinobacter]|jgi:hypothetical protein|uniref:Uncharacterized protein n=1 Tax=Marinobacter salsuginis TaxID=418719 RepID=A0A5M3PIB7_9GAMM|nr:MULTISPECIES: hypothetical protein [Marinobacter]GBO82604.1 hypothetical protein MS5N3_00550 [Marinobacter salsuginis]
MITTAIVSFLLLLAFMGFGIAYWQLLLCRREARILNSHRVAAHSALQKSRMDLLEVRNRARLLEDSVSGGASAVEKVHKAISNTTFGLIDLFSKDEEFRQTARKARATHDQTSQQIYRTVRTTNKALHILADTLIIGKAEKRLASRKRGKDSGSDDQ